MSENKVELKDIYDDAILQGTTDGAEIIKRCGAKVRIDGSTELMIRHLASLKADRLAEKLQESGEEFSLEEYCVRLS